MQPRNHGSRCPTNGVARARYTRGSIEDGPGVIIKRAGGLSSPIGLVMSVLLYGSLMNPQGWPAGSYFGESLEYGGIPVSRRRRASATVNLDGPAAGSICRHALGRGCFVAVWWRYLLESCSQPRDLLAFLQQFLLLESALRPRLFLLGLPARVSQERFFVEHEHAHQKLNLQLLLFDLLLQRRGLRLPLLRILRIRGRFLGYRLYGCVSPRSLCWAGGRAWRK